MLRFSCNAVSVHHLGCPEGKWYEGEMGQVGESAFLFFCLHLVPQNENALL